MTDKNVISFWKRRYTEEKGLGTNSDNIHLSRRCGTILYEIDSLMRNYNSYQRQILRNVHWWWWEYHIAERIMKRFNIVDKSIYDYPEATAVWKHCYQDKKCKYKPKLLKSNLRNQLVGYLIELRETDREHYGAYSYVIQQLERDYK